VFTAAQPAAWSRRHPDRLVRVIETLPDGRVRVEIDDEFALRFCGSFGCRLCLAHHAWRSVPAGTAAISEGQKTSAHWIGAVARTYATAPQYAEMAEAIAAQANVITAVAVERANPQSQPT
jgi:hypothetical protein